MSTILFGAEYYPPFAPGGAESSNAAWARALARRGHRVMVVTPNYGAEPRKEEDGVTVIRIPFPIKLMRGQGEVSQWAHRLLYPYVAFQIARIARREGAVVIHAQGKAALVPAWIAGALLRRPVFVTLRDLGLVCPVGMCPLFEPWTTFDCGFHQYVGKCVPFFLAHYMQRAGALRRARARLTLLVAWLDQQLRHAAIKRVRGVIAVSQGILSVYPERLVGGGRSAVVHTLPPEVKVPSDEEAARARARLGIGAGPLVLYAGKLSLGKGTPVLLEALDAIRAAVPAVRFAFAGKGDLAVPPAPDIHALGSIPHEDLFPLYRAADLVVVPSVWPEPLSRVVLEAMALGRPVVATAVGGMPEAVEHGVTGLLVPRQDPEALAKAVAELLLDPVRRRRMGEAAIRRAREVFDESRLVDALLDAYRAAGVAV